LLLEEDVECDRKENVAERDGTIAAVVMDPASIGKDHSTQVDLNALAAKLVRRQAAISLLGRLDRCFCRSVRRRLHPWRALTLWAFRRGAT
jgi:hypothetical protein